MKVMYVDQTGQLGGGELSLLDLMQHAPFRSEIALFADGPFRETLESLGFAVHLLSSGSAVQVRRESGLAAVLAAAPTLFKLRSRLARLIAPFDVIYANSQKAFFVSALARHRKQLLIWHLRDMLTADHFSPLLRRLAVTLGNHSASLVIANSQATADSFVQAGGRRDRVAVVYNGISPQHFDEVDDATIQATLRDLGLEGKFLVGVFGRLSAWKGQHILLEALSSLPSAHAVIIGEALFGEDAYAESLHKRAQSADLKGRVHFLGFRRDIPLLMKCMDIIAHTSTAPEPFGRVIVEGMLACRPVIATRDGGALEIVQEGETGLLVAPGSATELAEAITKLRAEPEFARRLASAGCERAVRHFSVHAMADGITKLLKQLQSRLDLFIAPSLASARPEDWNLSIPAPAPHARTVPPHESSVPASPERL